MTIAKLAVTALEYVGVVLLLALEAAVAALYAVWFVDYGP